MPLSEHEKQLLAEMERNFYASEADVVETAAPAVHINKRSLVLGIVLFVVGLALLLAGVATQLVVLGVAGFVVMVVAFWLPVSRRDEKATAQASDRRVGTNSTRERLTDRLERRWEERQNGER